MIYLCRFMYIIAYSIYMFHVLVRIYKCHSLKNLLPRLYSESEGSSGEYGRQEVDELPPE